ncbi:MAG: IclR family transcriptional regulator [Planctomycetota bacterium]|jgi:DNA-binding IclR family transcriptional regulator|nr:IclR family transcriptional regulator [Planctomycetota bacterium]
MKDAYGGAGLVAARLGGTDPTQSNLSTEKLLSLLECMTNLEGPARLQDLARTLGMNASTLLRFLAPLQRRGYVFQEPESGRYSLTFRLCALADSLKSRLDLRNLAFPFLREAAKVFGESANLSVDRDMSVLYVEVVNFPGKTLMMMQRIGHVAPLHCTGVGKLFLSEYSPRQLARYLKAKGLTRFTDRTLTRREDLERALEEIRRQGYAFDNEECEEGARCVAAPLRDYTGRIAAGLSVSGPAARMTDRHIARNLPYLLDAARQLSLRLGWREE